MKKYSYFVPAILLMQQAAAQSYSTPFIQKKAPCGKYHFFTDSSLLLQQKWKEYLQWQNDLKSLHDSVNYRHRNDMPFAGKIPAPVFQFNNGNGIDVYQSPVDHLPIIQPDSGFVTGMPVLKQQIITTPLDKNKRRNK